MACKECGKPLTEKEKFYLDGRCEECELDWHDEIKSWRNGVPNAELDKAYSMPKPKKH